MPAPSASNRAARLAKAAHIAVMAAVIAGSVVVFADLVVDTGQKIYYGWASRDWPAKVGTVLTSKVEQSGKARLPAVRYRYELGGRVIESGRPGNWWTYDNAYRFVEAFPAGAEVLVYHAPGGEASVLERGVRVMDVVALIVMLPFIGFLMLLYSAAMAYFLRTPADEQLAQWRSLRARGRRRPLVTPRSWESKAHADALMDAEIAERLRAQAARRKNK
ncbi:DUF3592 domain-containing protein [Massilia sp. SYSU DXS3249]